MDTIYWNDVDGYVTDDPQYALMYSTTGDLYTETYKLRNTDTFISISYTQFEKENANLYLLREAVMERNGYKLSNLEELVRRGVPNQVDDEALEEFEDLNEWRKAFKAESEDKG